MYGQTQILIFCFVPRLISAKRLMFFDLPVTAANIKQKGAGKKEYEELFKAAFEQTFTLSRTFFFFFFYKPPPREGCDLFPPHSVFSEGGPSRG